MKRREFIAGLGSTVALPMVTRAQGDRVRRIGMLSVALESDPETQAWRRAFVQRLQELGWTEGRNLEIEYRFATIATIPTVAKELVELRPDVLLAGATNATAALRQSTFSIPIVFAQVPDPIELGLVTSLAHPGGNITGFTHFQPAIAGKWLQTLKEISPTIKRVGLLFDPGNPSWIVYVRALEAAASSLAVGLTPVGVRDASEIERAIEGFAREANGGLVVIPSPATVNDRNRLLTLMEHHRLPAVYPYRYFSAAGGLASYGVDVTDLYRRAASYVDRILKGEKPGDLPIQQPTKFNFVINLNTARALGLTIPEALLATADEVIQ
jgi:putative tryptophan/tyrosine transport system substrate-binding protein